MPQAASNPNTRIRQQNLAKRLARERAARIIAGASQFPEGYQWPSANTNFGRARKVNQIPVNDFPTTAAGPLLWLSSRPYRGSITMTALKERFEEVFGRGFGYEYIQNPLVHHHRQLRRGLRRRREARVGRKMAVHGLRG
jgi:hypothetical protein